MIELIGVEHGNRVPLEHGSIELDVNPSKELVQKLQDMPRGSNIGLETLATEDYETIKANRRGLCYQQRLNVPFSGGTEYWEELKQICFLLGHRVVLLDCKQLYLKYNSAMIEVLKLQEEYDALQRSKEKGELKKDVKRETELEYRIYKASKSADRIVILERDKTLLDNISLHERIGIHMDVIITGLTHAEAWMMNKEQIRKDYGFELGRYSTEQIQKAQGRILPFVHAPLPKIFTENATPSSKEAYAFERLRRDLVLIEKGRFTSAEPGYVGLWDVDNFSSYFEIFIDEKHKGQCRGHIEDNEGSSEFAGIISPFKIDFLKTYLEARSAEPGLRWQYISHKGLLPKRNFIACWGSKSKGFVPYCCYIEKYKGSSPVEMVLSWVRINEALIKIQRRKRKAKEFFSSLLVRKGSREDSEDEKEEERNDSLDI